MVRMRAAATAMAAAIGVTVAACVETKHEALASPTQATQAVQTLTTGSWTSAATAAPASLNPGSCGNLEWKITSMTATAASGTFKASCGGGLTLDGTAEGAVSGLSAQLKASGTVTGSGTPCSFSLTGTAVLEGTDAVRVTYSGTTCLGPISGSEVLRKK